MLDFNQPEARQIQSYVHWNPIYVWLTYHISVGNINSYENNFSQALSSSNQRRLLASIPQRNGSHFSRVSSHSFTHTHPHLECIYLSWYINGFSCWSISSHFNSSLTIWLYVLAHFVGISISHSLTILK